MTTVKMNFTLLGGLSLALGILTAGSLIELSSASADKARAYDNRYQSYLLAGELRQSSDDLTRLGRTYVVTGDKSYKQQYMDILAIRNGEKPRPQAYNRIYWDFVAAGQAKPRPDGASAPLLTLMKQQGFTDAEFQQLEEAKKNSDGLVGLETEAMNLVEGLDKDGKPLAAPDQAKAIALVHSKQYHLYKAQIMAPIDRFFVLLDERTQSAIEAASARSSFWQSVSMGLIGLLVISVLTLCGYIYRNVVRSLSRFEATTHAFSAGNFEVEVAESHRRDEIGSIARSLQEFRNSMKRSAELAETQRAEQRTKEERTRKVNALMDDFDANVGNVVQSVSSQAIQMVDSAQSLSATAEAATGKASSVAAASEQATANVQTVASATEELTASIGEISRQVAQSSKVAASAVSEAERANQMVRGLTEAGQKIGAVVALITDIANQTNLLALNATIEAARAGEAGKGFAVVAAEVKNLANQTAKATEEIGGQISGVQAATQEAVQAIQTIGKTIAEINGIASTIAAAVEQQSAATKEIARNVEQAATGTQDVTSNITGVTQAANDTGSAASQVLTSAQDLTRHAETMRGLVTKFLAEVKSAA